MRLMTAALFTETNLTSPIPTGWDAFKSCVLHSAGAPYEPSFLTEPLMLWRRLAETEGHEVVESVAAAAMPGGPTARIVYEHLRDEIVTTAATEGPFDAVLLLLHGAMAADGYDDCEGDLLKQLRAALGSNPVIAAELDLHCNVSHDMLSSANLLIAFKEYPHVDVLDRARELYRLAIDAARGKIRFAWAIHTCPVVGLFFTQKEPMRGFVDRMRRMEHEPRVLSISLAHGFPFGSAGAAGACVMVYTDGDRVQADEVAKRVGADFWSIRREAAFSGAAIDEALERAERAAPGLVVLADTADNVGIGAPGDSTSLLRRVLERSLACDIALGPFWDPCAVSFCHDAGAGARLNLRIGGKCGPSSGDPLDLSVRVLDLKDDLRTPGLGDETISYGAAACIEVEDARVKIVLCTKRAQALHPALFTGIGVDLASQRIVIVKSTNHFQAAFRGIAREIIHVTGDGLGGSDMGASQ